jgi:hypothetical protein
MAIINRSFTELVAYRSEAAWKECAEARKILYYIILYIMYSLSGDVRAIFDLPDRF